MADVIWRACSAVDNKDDYHCWYVTDDHPHGINKTWDAIEAVTGVRPAQGLPFVRQVVAQELALALNTQEENGNE